MINRYQRTMRGALAAAVALAGAAVLGCASQGPFEEAGEEVDEVVDEIDDEVDERRRR